MDESSSPTPAGAPLAVIPTGMLKIEASSACQLRCPSCPTTTGATAAVIGQSWLRLADFVKLVDDNPWVGRIELSNYGEAFLNPDLLEIFRHAYRRGVTLQLANGVNLNHVREEVLEGLVQYQVAFVNCSIDGATQGTYERYRVKGNLDRVLANIRRINDFKKARGSSLPQLAWQFIAFGYNEDEIPAARQMAQELGMEFRVKLNWDPSFAPTVNKDLVRAASGTGAASREEFREKNGGDYMEGLCMDLWASPQVNWDGKMLGCCRNYWGDFGGNAFRDGLAASLNGEKRFYAIEMLRGRAPPRDDIPRTKCDIYAHRRQAKRWVVQPAAVARKDIESLFAKTRDAAAIAQSEGRMDDAARMARILLQLRPDSAEALNMLEQAARIAGREDAARYFAGRVEKLGGSEME